MLNNFLSSGNGYDFTNFGCPFERCNLGALGTLDFSHNKGRSFHLDTGDPNTFPVGTLRHLVDVGLGNFWYTVIPRPWP